MTIQTTPFQNVRRLLLGEPLDYQVVATTRKKQLSVFIPLSLATAAITVMITTLWVMPQYFFNQPQEFTLVSEIVANEEEIVVPALPTRLKIESINVEAAIETVSLTADGAMDTPDVIERVGWFDIGPRPGEMGSAVVTGHLYGENGEAGVFQNLSLLKVGDEISITDDNNISRTFVVLGSRTYDWNDDAPEVFYSTDGKYLNLITCSGLWSITQEKFEKRFVVFTKIKSY